MNPLRDLGGLPAGPSNPLLHRWDRELIEELIAENHEHGFQPACLILGKREAAMLRRHLGKTFGPTAALSLKNTYYLGLKIVEDSATSFLCVAGRLSALAPQPGSGEPSSRTCFGSQFSGHRWKYTG